MAATWDIATWWASRMAELLPSGLGGGLPRRALLADARPGEAGVTLSVRRGRREERLSRPPRDARRRKLLVRLPAGAVLERTLPLPAAAEPELPRVVAWEIDRISPFVSAEVASAYRVELMDRAAGKMLVRVALLPRAAVAPAAATLRGMGLNDPWAATAPRAGGGDWLLALRPEGLAPRTAWDGAARSAAAACVLLALGCAAVPFVVQEVELARVEARIAQARPGAEEVAGLRRRMAERDAGTAAAAVEAARAGRMLEQVATVTALLPDDTYLTTLGIRQRVLNMAGRSAAAARLIPLLEADPALRNAAFSAPVTRAEGPRGDVFSIRAEFRR